MTLRVSLITAQLVVLDEYDAPQQAQPITFFGDKDGTAVEKARVWLDAMPDKLAEAEAAASADST